MNLLFPGRHVLNTNFQQEYLTSVLGRPLSNLHFRNVQPKDTSKTLDNVIFAITSANLDTSRFSPVTRDARMQLVTQFANTINQLNIPISYQIIAIPHYPATPQFAHHIINEIAEQTDYQLKLDSDNTVVLSSTNPVSDLFENQGFAVLPAESGQNRKIYAPQEILTQIIESDNWQSDTTIRENIHPCSLATFSNQPWVIDRAKRLATDPLLTDSGSLTEGRDYNTYAMGMDNPVVLDIKYKEVKPFIKEGRVVDEGCSTGSLLLKISKDFRDSDLMGVEITGEFYSRCLELQRSGAFGKSFIHFHQRNALQPIFEPNSIDTVICNSTIREYFSYGEGEKSINTYLDLKHNQLANGGRLIIRDVVGPKNKDQIVYMECEGFSSDFTPLTGYEDKETFKNQLEQMSTFERFIQFSHDYLSQNIARGQLSKDANIQYEQIQVEGKNLVKLRMKDAYEFMTKYMYTDNWMSETQEQFGFFNLEDWKNKLHEKGFKVLTNPHDEDLNSRAYMSDFTKENHWNNKISLFEEKDGSLQKMEYPVTNMVLAAEKVEGK